MDIEAFLFLISIKSCFSLEVAIMVMFVFAGVGRLCFIVFVKLNEIRKHKKDMIKADLSIYIGIFQGDQAMWR